MTVSRIFPILAFMAIFVLTAGRILSSMRAAVPNAHLADGVLADRG